MEYCSKWGLCSCHQFPHGLFYLLIPQTVDQGIQHGDDHCVKHRHHFNLAGWMAWLWYDINKCNCPIKQGDCGEVGGTVGEGLVPALSRAHPEDGVKDVEVRNNDDEQGDDNDGACWDGRGHFSHVNMGTRKLHQWREVTEEMVDFIWSTESQTQ